MLRIKAHPKGASCRRKVHVIAGYRVAFPARAGAFQPPHVDSRIDQRLLSCARLSWIGGFSLAELMVTIAVIAVLAAIGIPLYQGYKDTAELGAVIQEMKQIELVLENHKIDSGAYPISLDEVGINMLDPWGNPYQYLPIEGVGNNAKGHQRKDHNLVPINSDFDLYSMGEDGSSAPPLTAKSSRDDIIRANDGGYYGYGKDY